MSTTLDVVQLSRLQFGLTAMYHFLFVPLTLGLSLLLGIMESVYVMTGKEVWRQMTKFWGALFGINFAMGVATGVTMEFQFGMNWAYYSHYVGDIFGAPLAIEGLMAFFLEATFVGLFFFGWDRLSKVGHLCVTWLVAAGANLSALWILIANGWMQHPVGSHFNPETMRMEVSDFGAIIFNQVAQEKFVHTVSAGYVTGAMFVAAVSALYLLRGKHIAMARRSMTVAVSFGLASALSVVVLGDASGYTATENQKMKIAAIEAMWETEPPPASFTLFGYPNQAKRQTEYALRLPWVLGLITTHSIDTEVPGIKELVERNEQHIRTGLIAYSALQKLRADHTDAKASRGARSILWRSRLRAPPQEVSSKHRASERRGHLESGLEYRAGRGSPVLELPRHGRLWLPLYLSFWCRLFPCIDRAAMEVARIALDAGLRFAAALDCRRGRMVCRGSRATALGNRRGPANFSCRVEPFRAERSCHALRFH